MIFSFAFVIWALFCPSQVLPSEIEVEYSASGKKYRTCLFQDNARLTSRLREAEKNLRMYQQRIVDSLNSVDPIRKELEDVKNQLLTELREKNRYQCEVEVSLKSNRFDFLYCKISIFF